MPEYHSDEAAYSAAKKAAKRARDWRYVVTEGYGPDRVYGVASDYDLETFWNGATVVAAIGPDGNPEYNGA